MSKHGVRVAAVTDKDKLRRISRHGLQGAICFSSEKAVECSWEENGVEDVEKCLRVGRRAPEQYSGDLSLFVVDAGIKILEGGRADLIYLTLSDYIQHKYAPGSKESNDFFTQLDQRLGRLEELEVQVAVNGDHGMSDKCNADGTPNVLYPEDMSTEKFGQGSARVICPITDPFVRHHGALGSFVRVYLNNKNDVEAVLQLARSLPQVEVARGSRGAAEKFELALDGKGDVVVVSKKHAVIGGRRVETRPLKFGWASIEVAWGDCRSRMFH